MYLYYVVRSDPTFAATTDASSLKAFLVDACHLIRKDDCVFSAAPGLPWAEVIVAIAGSTGNYGVTSQGCSERINVVEVVCSESDADSGRTLAEKIAQFVGWEVACEDDERVGER